MPAMPIDTEANQLRYDAQAYSPLLAGVASACDHTSSVTVSNPRTPSVSLTAFGAVGPALLEFNQAWSDEAACALGALEEILATLPVMNEKMQQADSKGGTVVSSSGVPHERSAPDRNLPPAIPANLPPAIPKIDGSITQLPSGTGDAENPNSPSGTALTLRKLAEHDGAEADRRSKGNRRRWRRTR